MCGVAADEEAAAELPAPEGASTPPAATVHAEGELDESDLNDDEGEEQFLAARPAPLALPATELRRKLGVHLGVLVGGDCAGSDSLDALRPRLVCARLPAAAPGLLT